MQECNRVGFIRTIICIIFPPLAVLDKGCGSVVLVTCLTIFGWVPGIIAALLICSVDEVARHNSGQMDSGGEKLAKDDTIDVEVKEL